MTSFVHAAHSGCFVFDRITALFCHGQLLCGCACMRSNCALYRQYLSNDLPVCLLSWPNDATIEEGRTALQHDYWWVGACEGGTSNWRRCVLSTADGCCTWSVRLGVQQDPFPCCPSCVTLLAAAGFAWLLCTLVLTSNPALLPLVLPPKHGLAECPMNTSSSQPKHCLALVQMVSKLLNGCAWWCAQHSSYMKLVS